MAVIFNNLGKGLSCRVMHRMLRGFLSVQDGAVRVCGRGVYGQANCHASLPYG